MEAPAFGGRARAGDHAEVADSARIAVRQDVAFPGIAKEVREAEAVIRAYLLALSKLAAEVADRPELLREFMKIIALAPRTVSELRRGG